MGDWQAGHPAKAALSRLPFSQTMKSSRKQWFDVDRDGLRELYASFPPERMVYELIQNAWDEKSSVCDVSIIPAQDRTRRVTIVTVRDDNPDGFRNLADAYTLFRTTTKRTDPTKRGRFNFGEKMVLSRAIRARITSTTGEIRFDEAGRHSGRTRRDSGTEVEVVFPRWSASVEEQALTMLRKLLPPASCAYFLNGQQVPVRIPELTRETTLTTEILRVVDDGLASMTRSPRKTTLELYPRSDVTAYLYEMGIPVCPIAGDHDANVLQKVPLSADRISVPDSYMQDVYAEIVLALGERLNPESFGTENLQIALQDERVTPEAAKQVFHRVYGENAALQSHEPDSDQEAARHGYTMVPSRAWGKVVNDKMREAGVSTTHDLFGRQNASESAQPIEESSYTPAQRRFVNAVQMLAREIYGDHAFSVGLATWTRSNWVAFNSGGSRVVFHPGRVDIEHPLSASLATILHELAHCKGDGHDGVYDTEFERIVNRAAVLLIQRPDLFRPFEPELWESK